MKILTSYITLAALTMSFSFAQASDKVQFSVQEMSASSIGSISIPVMTQEDNLAKFRLMNTDWAKLKWTSATTQAANQGIAASWISSATMPDSVFKSLGRETKFHTARFVDTGAENEPGSYEDILENPGSAVDILIEGDILFGEIKILLDDSA